MCSRPLRSCWLSVACGATLALAPEGNAQVPCCRAEGLTVAERYRAAGLDDRHFNQEALRAALAPALRSARVRVTRLGASVEGRPIRAFTFGSGPEAVLLWSQMHGDESTATMALADMILWFATGADDDVLRRELEDRLTITMIPMLNPDGAELFVRENAVGVDVNRDARRTATPEGRILKSVRDSIGADFGFNLHDQGTRTAGQGGPPVGIALLAPAADESRSWGPVRERARRVAATIAAVLAPEIGGRIARYDDAFSPRAFGDNMQAWGTSTVLIESGVLPDDPQKQRLRALNVVALLTALHAIASGDHAGASTEAYDRLPENRGVDSDLLLLGGRIVLGGSAPVLADVAIRFDDPAARAGARYEEIGDLDGIVALDTLDVTGLYLHVDGGEAGVVRPGDEARLVVRRGPGPDSEAVRSLGGGP